ncbi:PQQ-binding-like beta-propeller repeat protein [Nocardioides sp. NPDC051685]|uniref:outer membrane protein assembly factor BamB family protein n=1 Tax=Nocardioides sp. NPDC051685 TaxID=3364334 RepID=UPI0037AE4E29
MLTYLSAALIVIALLIGAVVVVAKGRAHDNTAGDVVWRAPIGIADPAGAVVVGENTYVYARDEVEVHGPDGISIAVGEHRDAYVAAIGDTGHFALAGSDTISFFDPMGNVLWRRDLDGRPHLNSIVAIGDGDLSYLSCPGQKACEIVHLAAHGRETWRYSTSSADLSSAVRSTFTPDGDRDPALSRVPPMPVEVTDTYAVMLENGKPWGAKVRSQKYGSPVQFGQTLIGITDHGNSCRYDAVKNGRHLWDSAIACPLDHLSWPGIQVFGNGLMLSYRDGPHGHAIVKLDVETGKARLVELPSYPEDATTIETFMTEKETVRRVDGTLTAFSVSTGEELWSKQLPDRADVSMDGGTLTVTKDYNPIWHHLALHNGEIPNDQIEAWSTKTGEKTSGVAATNILATANGDFGGAVVVTEDELIKIGS